MYISLSNSAKKALTTAILTLGMLIFATTVLFGVEVRARKAEAEVKLLIATIDWYDYQRYKKDK